MVATSRTAKGIRVMERKIGEKFEFIGHTLIVSEPTCICEGCFFNEHNLACYRKEINDITGSCCLTGNQGVIFKEVKD